MNMINTCLIIGNMYIIASMFMADKITKILLLILGCCSFGLTLVIDYQNKKVEAIHRKMYDKLFIEDKKFKKDKSNIDK